MVSVPVTTRNSAELQPLGRDRLRYTAPRNVVGPAVERFGQAIGQAAETLDEIEALRDDSNKLELHNSFKTTRAETLSTFRSLRGSAPDEQMPQVVGQLERKAEELLKTARSPRARMIAKRAFDVEIQTARETMLTHSNEQLFEHKDTQLQAQVELFGNDAVEARGTDQFALNLINAQETLAKLQRHRGWDDAKLALERDKLVENIYGREILAIDDEDGEPTRALERLEEVKDSIGPALEGRLRSTLNPRVDAAWANGLVEGGGLVPYLPGNEPRPAAEADASDKVEAVSLAVPFAGQGTTVPGGRYGARRDYGGHTGVDYAGLPAGTPVPPSAPGVVTKSEYVDGYGHRVEVDHGSDAQGRRITTTYSHLNGRKVKAGDRVDASTELGGVGSSGGNYGTHLHWEVLVDGQKVDPSTIAEVQVRPGAPGVPADARLNSQQMRAAVDRYIAATPGTSERRRQALYAAADQAVSRGRADRAQAEQDADRRLQDWLTQNKAGADDLTSMADIPASLITGVSPATMAALNGRVQAAQSRIQAKESEEAAARAGRIEEEAVFELYTLTDEQLAATDLRRYSGRVDLETLGPWIDRQQRVANGAVKKPVSSDRIAARIDSIAEPYGASRGKDAEADERAAWIALRGFVERRVAGRLNADVSDEDLRAIIIEGMTDVEVKGTGWFRNDRVARAQAPASGNIEWEVPSPARDEIVRNLRARGREPSPDLVWSTYQQGRARGLFP